MIWRSRLWVGAGILALLFHGTASGGPIEDGIAARKRGDFVTALRLLSPLAEQGDVAAETALGDIYASFQTGAPRNLEKAVAWFRKAAERGYAEAQYDLGFMYDNGLGVPQDEVLCFAWTMKAAEQGDEDAQFQVATRYEYGRGVPQNFSLAAIWLSKAAEQGDTLSQDRLASYYIKGLGVPQDYVRAHMWLNIAAAREPDHKLRELIAASRDDVASKMTCAQIAEAQKLASEWVPKSASRP